MPSTYSTSLRLELIGNGEQSGSWGNTNNINLGTLLEQAIAGVENVAISGTSYTLTTGNGVSDQARNAVIVLTGTLSANCNVIVPSVDKTYTFRNATTGGFSVVIKTAAGSGVTIGNGFTQSVYCDATNVVAAGVPFNNDTNTISGNVTGNLTGNVAVGAGTAATPSASFSGDPDTGIFNPDANEIGISTAGAEKVRINSIGVGIGKSVPGSEFDVKGTLRLSGSTSGYVGFSPQPIAGSTTYTLPSADGISGQILSTDGAGNLSWAGFIQFGTGAVQRTMQNKMRDIVSVKDFGAIGNGIADDYQSIQAAIDYAFSVNKGIYFPSGVYKINTGLNMTVGCESAPNTQIRGGAAIDVVTIAPGNYSGTYFNFPQIAFGTNGLVLNGVSLATIFIPSIALCSDNGLVLQVTDINKVCADNVITFNTVNNIDGGAAIKFSYLATTTAGVLMQGNQIKGNFAVNTLYGVYFYDVNSGALGANLPWDDTQVDVFAIDPNNLSGSIGFYANATFPAGRTFLYAKGFFDAMDDAYIKGNCINNPIFVISNSGQWNYTKFKQTGPARIINASSGQGNLPGVNPIPTMTTTYNTLATFNSGVPLQANRNILQFTVDAPLASGDSATFYFYHMLMSQYKPKVTAEALWEAPMYVQACCESSTPGLPGPGSANPYPFQGTLIVRATGAVAAGTYQIAITVEDAAQ